MSEGPKWWFWAVVFAALTTLAALGTWRGSARLEQERSKGAEAQRLRDQGLLVTVESERNALKASVAALTATNVDLAKQVAELKARPVEVRVLETGPTAAAGAPRPDPTPATSCLLAAGDAARIKVEEVTLETKLDNHVVVGTAEVFRLDPKGPTLILHAPFQANLSRVERERPPEPRGQSLGLGALGLFGPQGWEVGPAVSPPPLDFLWLRWEVTAGAAFGPSGGWAVLASVLARR